MDDDTFVRGRHNPQEGGPKGIDLDLRTNVLAVTSEFLPLAFFDVEAALEQPEPDRADAALLRYELDVQAETDGVKGTAAEDRAQLVASRHDIERLRESIDRQHRDSELLRHDIDRQQHDIDRLLREKSELGSSYESSRSWRVTKPLRAVTAELRHLRSR